MLQWLREWWQGVMDPSDELPPYPLADGDLDDESTDPFDSNPSDGQRVTPKRKPAPTEWQGDASDLLSPAF